ncbi:hypothetical protein FJZ21_03155 [Candidatus Pacearchaeota archaeon]|nr:hypothetical protein [Candidatus Pacearchaeota archaeon]
MLGRNYAGALALSALLGCSIHSDQNHGVKTTPQQSSGYIESSTATLEEENALNSYIQGLQNQERIIDPLRGRRVSLLYSTRDGPISGSDGYTGGRPVDPGLLGIVRDQLRERGAYVLERAVFGGSYGMDISISRGPKMNPPEFIVIADQSPRLDGNTKNVYFVKKDGNGYKLVEANR